MLLGWLVHRHDASCGTVHGVLSWMMCEEEILFLSLQERASTIAVGLASDIFVCATDQESRERSY